MGATVAWDPYPVAVPEAIRVRLPGPGEHYRVAMRDPRVTAGLA